MKKPEVDIETALATCDQMVALMGPFQRARDVLNQVKTLEAYNQELQDTITGKNQEIEDLTHDLDSIQGELDTLRSTREKEIAAIEDDFKQKENALHAAHAEKGDEIEKEFERLRGSKVELEEEHDKLQSSINQLKAEKRSLLADISGLERQKKKAS